MSVNDWKMIQEVWSVVQCFVLFLWAFGSLAVFLRPDSPGLLGTIKRELHPFIPVVLLINIIHGTWGSQGWGMNAFTYFINIVSLIGWLLQDDDDDRWKRRRRRLASKVASAGHRLTVVPAGRS